MYGYSTCNEGSLRHILACLQATPHSFVGIKYLGMPMLPRDRGHPFSAKFNTYPTNYGRHLGTTKPNRTIVLIARAAYIWLTVLPSTVYFRCYRGERVNVGSRPKSRCGRPPDTRKNIHLLSRATYRGSALEKNRM